MKSIDIRLSEYIYSMKWEDIIKKVNLLVERKLFNSISFDIWMSLDQQIDGSVHNNINYSVYKKLKP